VFNLQGSEIIFILLIALVVLGPEKLPGAIRRATKTYAELRKMGDSFQSEFKAVIDEPMRELRDTANLIKDQADPKKVAEAAEREAAENAKALAAAQSMPTENSSSDTAALDDETAGSDEGEADPEVAPPKADYFGVASKTTSAQKSAQASIDRDEAPTDEHDRPELSSADDGDDDVERASA
jgi:sec-independent protein translocase protein TatB